MKYLLLSLVLLALLAGCGDAGPLDRLDYEFDVVITFLNGEVAIYEKIRKSEFQDEWYVVIDSLRVTRNWAMESIASIAIYKDDKLFKVLRTQGM